MKSIFIAFCLCMSLPMSGQTTLKKDSLSISLLLQHKQDIQYKDYSLIFKTLISDSRCPKDVMCIRAGGARLVVSINKDGKHIDDKELYIDASGYVSDKNNLISDMTDFKIYGIRLSPYPKSSNKIPLHNYSLEVIFQPKDVSKG